MIVFTCWASTGELWHCCDSAMGGFGVLTKCKGFHLGQENSIFRNFGFGGCFRGCGGVDCEEKEECWVEEAEMHFDVLF